MRENGTQRDLVTPRRSSGSREARSSDGVTLAGLLSETALRLRRYAGPKWEEDYGLPPQSFEVLAKLARAPQRRLRMSELAAQTALTRSGLTRAVDRLLEAGLVEREGCDEDRRGAFARLTPEGSRKTAGALRCHRTELERLLDGALAPGEREVLVALLCRLRDGLSCRPCPRGS